MNQERSADENRPAEAGAESQHLEARREVLKRLGIYGATTAPVLLAMLQSEKAIAQTGPAIPGGGGTTPGGSTIF